MRILVLGGTRFLGRHLVEAARARGHDVTTFTRGRLPKSWPGGVTGLLGERDPRLAPELAALESGKWDAAIEWFGYVARVVKAGRPAPSGPPQASWRPLGYGNPSPIEKKPVPLCLLFRR